MTVKAGNPLTAHAEPYMNELQERDDATAVKLSQGENVTR